MWSEGKHGQNSSVQDVVTYAQEVSNPVTGYVKMKVSYGSCQIVKTSEDGKVDGINFTITGNGVNQTVTTANGGKFQIDNLMPGVYTVTEQSIDKYVPQETHRVTVVAGQVATVNFNNVLKRGNLQVIKSSEDNFVEGVKFHLYGTSLAGIAVDEYAVTDKNGVAIHKVGAEPKLFTIEHNLVANDVTEQVMKGNIAIIKHTDDGETKIETPEKGAEFEIYLKASGSFEKADKDEKDTIVCDENGFGQTKDMPYGVYTVHQTKGWEGREFMKDFDKGDVVDTVTTDEDGTAKSKELYLGKYTVVETKAPTGMVINKEKHSVELTYAGQDVAVTETATSFVNERQKVKISLEKILEQDETFGIGKNDEIKNISFGLYAKEDVVSSSGTVIPSDGLLEIITLDENGTATANTDLPFGSYYIKEIATDEHYVLSDTQYQKNTQNV